MSQATVPHSQKRRLQAHYGFTGMPFRKSVKATQMFDSSSQREFIHGLLLTLKAPLLEPLRSRFLFSHQLRPFTLEDTRNYIDFHLTSAGARADLLSDDAKKQLFMVSRGAPRLVNQAVLHVLILGVLQGLDRLDGALVKRAIAAHPLLSRGEA